MSAPHEVSGIVLVGVIVVLVIMALVEAFWARQRRHERAQTESDWANMQENVRKHLGKPGRENVIADVRLRAVATQAKLDHICQVTATSLGAPAAVITVVEIEGQRWLAHYGAEWCDDDTRIGLIQPLSTSYCQYVVTTDHPLVVMDSLKDVRLKTNDPMTLKSVRAYIGAPVHTEDGVAVGSLCVFDSKPRKWTTRDKATVESFASLVTL